MVSRQSWARVSRGAIRHGPKALLVFLATVLLGVVLALLMPAKYRSEARLLTLPADYYAVRGRDKADSGAAEAFKPEELANVEMQLLSSQDLQRDVLIRSGAPANDPVALERAREAMAKNLSIARVDGANVIELGYTAGRPQEAMARLQELLDIYFKTRARVLTSGRSQLIAQEREAARRQLDSADTALRSFQERNGIVDIQAQVNGAVALDSALRQDLAATRADLSQTRSNASQLRSSSAAVPRNVELFRDDTEATRAIAEMQGQILSLEAKRADLQGRYMQGSPLIEQVDKQIAGLRTAIGKQGGQLREARRIGRNSYYDEAKDRAMQSEAAAVGQAAKIGRLGHELSDSQLHLRNLNTIAGTVFKLQAERDAAQERFRSLTTQLEEARARELEASTGSTNVRVIQRPSLPEHRSNSPLMLIAGSIVAGLAIASGLLFFLIVQDEGFADASEVSESLGVPLVLDRSRALRDNRLASLLGPAADQHRGQVIAFVATEASAFGEELASLIALVEGRDGGRVAVVSFEETAYALSGRSLAQLIPARKGRAWIKVGSVAWTIDSTGERLLACLRLSYRRTIILVPPVAASSVQVAYGAPGLVAAALADDVLLLVHNEATRRTFAKNLVEALRDMQVTVRGFILLGHRSSPNRFAAMLGRPEH